MSPNIAYMRYAIFKDFQKVCQVIKCKNNKIIIDKAGLLGHPDESRDPHPYCRDCMGPGFRRGGLKKPICGKMKRPPRCRPHIFLYFKRG